MSCQVVKVARRDDLLERIAKEISSHIRSKDWLQTAQPTKMKYRRIATKVIQMVREDK
jgi:hypothetical protein